MAWQELLTNRLKLIIKAIEELWESLEKDPEMFVVFIKKDDINKKIFMAEKDKDKDNKIVRVFSSYSDADKYMKMKNGKTPLYIGVMQYTSIYNSIKYISKNEGIECILTGIGTDGIVYDIEKIWQNEPN